MRMVSNRNWTFLTTCALSVILAAGTSQGQARFSDSNNALSFTPPTSWTKKPHPDAIAIFVEPLETQTKRPVGRKETDAEFLARIRSSITKETVDQAFLANITLSVLPVQVRSLNEYLVDSRKRVSVNKTLRILGERTTKLAGEPAQLRATRVANPGDPILLTREIITYHRGHIYQFTLTTLETVSNKYQPVFEACVNTFRWQP